MDANQDTTTLANVLPGNGKFKVLFKKKPQFKEVIRKKIKDNYSK